jgi:hypothetical protein
MQSAMPRGLTSIPSVKIPRSTFNRTHGYKTTFDAGYLVPFYCDEVLPGDTFNLNATLFARLSTPLHPTMDNMYMDTQFFFVPNRIIWDNFKAFMGETRDAYATSYLIPVLDSTTYPAAGFASGTIYDYLGLPVLIPNTAPGFIAPTYINALPLRALNSIYNFWYRDQNIQVELPTNTGDGPDDMADYALFRRGKQKDYFTGALPWPQKSSTLPNVASQFPIYGAPAPVTGIGKANNATWTGASVNVYETGNATPVNYPINDNFIVDPAAANDQLAIRQDAGGANYPAIYAQLNNASMYGIVNELRTAVQIQRFYERDARGGNRYSELVYSHFGVTFPAPIDRPEYLGGSSDMINITPVAQTSKTDTSPQGNLAGYGTGFTRPRFTKSFNEHGYVIGLVSVRADLNYQQNIDKMWTRSTKFDFFWPTFAHLGEQPVMCREIGTSFTIGDDNVFGYQERYAEYRYKPSLITGLFRSAAAGSLDSWHLAQDFTVRPSLNPSFIQSNPPIARIVAVPAEPNFIMDSVVNLKCARPMPVISVPGMMDHF